MNAQELIEELECLEVATDSLDFLKGAHYANERAISLAKQLKESQHSISSNGV
ncbi:RNA-binding protein, partial [Enterococcus faecalis]|nr:RNA-binding protein [Enterococcus faecalis]